MNRRLLFIVFIFVCALVGCSSGSSSGTVKSPEDLIKGVAKSLQELPAYTCKLDKTIDITAQGIQQKIESAYDVTIAKPNRWAIVQKSGMMGGTSVSDGKEITYYAPMTDSYAVQPYEDQVDDSSASYQAFMMLGAGALSKMFMGTGIEDFIFKDVKKARLLGEELIDGTSYQVAEIERKDGSTIKIWVDTGNQFLVRRLVFVPDLSAMANAMAGKMQGMKMSLTLDITDWDINSKPADEEFVFVPPGGAKKVDSLFRSVELDEGPHPLLGEQAPEFTAKDLNGDVVELASHRDKNVVILDFWATWCSPCTAALPIIAEVAESFADRNVVFYAVNEGETVEVIKEFLTESSLELPILSDEESAIGEQYQVSGIPQTVLIDKKGRVQVVHVGFGGDLKQQLSQELEDILAGKDVATAELEMNKTSGGDVAVESSGMIPAWRKRGRYTGIAVDDNSERIIALQQGGQLSIFSISGELVKTLTLPDAERHLRTAQLITGADPEFLTFHSWGNFVRAYSSAGELLWTKDQDGAAVDDVGKADLQDDGTDDVIIGYNGGTGLFVVDNKGIAVWDTARIGNVWNVTSGKFLNQEEVQVISTSGRGLVHVFDREGRLIKDITLSLYGHNVRFKPGIPSGVVVSGTDGDDEAMVFIDSMGKEKWKIEIPTNGENHVDSLAVDASGRYAVVGTRGGLVHVVDLTAGEIATSVGGQGSMPEVGILTNIDGKTLVVIATGRTLNAFTLDPSLSE